MNAFASGSRSAPASVLRCASRNYRLRSYACDGRKRLYWDRPQLRITRLVPLLSGARNSPHSFARWELRILPLPFCCRAAM